MNNTLEIKLSEYKIDRAGRVVAIELKDKIISMFEKGGYEKLILDFSDVVYITSGFAKELFAGLYNKMGDAFKDTIKIRIDKDDEVMKTNILRAIKTAMTPGN